MKAHSKADCPRGGCPDCVVHKSAFGVEHVEPIGKGLVGNAKNFAGGFKHFDNETRAAKVGSATRGKIKGAHRTLRGSTVKGSIRGAHRNVSTLKGLRRARQSDQYTE